MKDTDKVELTVNNVKAAAESCGAAKEVLKKLFPKVFEESPEWEDITEACSIVPFGPNSYGGRTYIRTPCGNYPFRIVFSKSPEIVFDDDGIANYTNNKYKTDGNRIWRRKS